jgi:hypothetical protein
VWRDWRDRTALASSNVTKTGIVMNRGTGNDANRRRRDGSQGAGNSNEAASTTDRNISDASDVAKVINLDVQ